MIKLKAPFPKKKKHRKHVAVCAARMDKDSETVSACDKTAAAYETMEVGTELQVYHRKLTR